MKKIISMIMVFVLLFGSVPVTARAENETASETVPVEMTEQTSGSENMSDTDEEQREAEKTEHAKEEETEPEETEPGDGASDVVTRIQWLHDLTVTFGMTVEEDNYPDNYYSDIDSASEYYYDVMLATEFGLVDAEAGEPFRPNDPATREFAAHTLNLCLGFRLEEESSYTFSESAEVTYPDDIQIAIDRGWFQLEDGAFHPEIPVTSAEKNSMLTSAAEIQASTEIDPNHTNQYGFSDGVIVLPEGTEIELTDENEFTITNCPAELSVGDLFAVVNHNFPVVKRVAALEVSGASTVITAESVDTEEAYTDLDLEGTMDVDLANVQAYDDSLELYYIVGGSEQAKWDDGVRFSSLQEVGDQKISAVEIVKSYDIPESVRSQYNLAPGVKANITCKISEVGVSYNSSLIDVSAYLNLNTTAAFTCNVSMDVLQAVGADSNITLAKVRVGYIGFMTVTLDLSLKGDITLALAEYISAGVQYKAKDGFRLTSNFRKKSFTISGQAEASAGITAEAGVDCVFIKGSIWGKIGGKTRVTVKTFDDGNLPGRCTHFAAWLYASVGCKIKLDIKVYKKNWGKTIALYDESNSPVKVVFHYEDGVPVDRCTRDPEGTYQYYTPADSQYGYNGASSGTGSDGELYTIFEYSLDDNNNATITSYRGNVAALVIPETIDGYTVVGIGSGVFAGKARLINVIVPDTITYIGSAAFKNCTSLNSVKLSSGLKTVGSRIFCNCTSLVNINIPAHIETVEDIYDSGWRTGEWFAGCDNLKAVTFDEGITRINRVFNNWTALEQIEIPETVTVIQAYAFADCTALKDVTIPDTVTEIGEGAFVNCRTIEEIEIPDSVIRIGSAAFKNCTSLNSVKLSSGLKTAGSRIFCNCTSLVNINIPAHIETVEDIYDNGWRTGEWFAGCDNLKAVTFDEGITRINRLFNNWTVLEQIEIPETVTVIQAYAFADCTALKDVTIPDTVTEIGEGAFVNCRTIEEIEIPDSVIRIGSAAFKNCTSLNSVKLSSGLKTAGSRIFCNCTSLVNINIPVHIETVEDFYDSGWRTGEWFAGCDNLKAVTFDEGITRINRLFNNWTALERIEIPETVTVIQAYAFADCTALKDVTIPDTVTEIGEGAFVNCRTIEEIEIPDSVIRIGSAAFKNCTSLNSVKLSSGLKTAGSRIFCNCTSLVNINIPAHIETVEEFYDSGWRTGEWFAGCDSLKEVTFDEGITRINRVFNNWTALERIEIPETVTTVGGAAFADCTSLKGVIIPDTVIKIGNDVFSGCTSLESAQWNNTISTIPDRTFKNCSSLTQFSLTPVITAIGADAFYGCSSLSELNWNENIAVIGSGVFRFCDALKDIVIPESVTTVSQYAFYNCSGLQSVVIGNAVTAIGKEAFYDCDALVSVRVANSVASMGTSVFYDCDALTDVTLGTGLTSIPASAFEHCDSLVSIVLPYRVASVGENAFKNCIKFTSITIPRATTSIAASAFSYPARMTIYGVSGTYAETYASENGIAFVDQTVPAAAVALSSTELTLNKGTAATLFMTVTPADFTDEVAWKSSNTSVATVNDSGVVTAAGLGTAIIKITVGNVSASCKVTVVQPVTSISLNQTSLTMDALDTFQLIATANPSDAYNREIVWSSSDETVAVVTEDGLVTAIGKGTATVTATAADGSGVTRKCTVTVRNNAYVVANQGDLESPHPYDNNCSDMWVYTQNGVSELILNFDNRTELEEDFDFLHIYDGNGNEIGRYTGTELSGVQVTVPGDTVRIKLVTDNGGTAWGFKVNQPETPFTDVSQSAWYYSTVKEAYELGLMTGTTSTTFAPNSPMTRAMATAVLYRISGSPAIEYESIFSDVADGKYYSKCVTWAAKNKIVNGYAADNTFRPNANVTREQMAVILYNYAKFRGLDVSVQADLSSFHDAGQISSYARTAMSWAVGNKLMSGTLEGNLNPKNEATRAECAKMLLQTYKLIEGNP